VLQNADIELGKWDAKARKFTVYTGSDEAYATAVRVTAERSAARGDAEARGRGGDRQFGFERGYGRFAHDGDAVAFEARRQLYHGVAILADFYDPHGDIRSRIRLRQRGSIQSYGSIRGGIRHDETGGCSKEAKVHGRLLSGRVEYGAERAAAL